ncbi:MAG: GGDEF domain-containing protein [Rubrivivax sp.]
MSDQPTVVIDVNDVSLLRGLGAPTQPCLILYSGADAGQRFDLEPGMQHIGRAPEAQVRIDAPGVSRRHAELLVSAAGQVVLSDLGSANGTLVNEQRIEGPTTLKDGDLVRVSKLVLRFHSRNTLDLLLHDRIYAQATIDAGTGAFNRRFIHDMLKQRFAKSRASGRPLSVICYDLDHFKQVNDTYGHASGDIVLRTTTDIARAELRDTDTLGRTGGEEFTIVLEGTPVSGALELAERIRAAMEQFPIELPDPLVKTSSKPVEHRQTVSMGVAELSPDMASELDLLQAGDRALYEAKRRGRNQVCI